MLCRTLDCCGSNVSCQCSVLREVFVVSCTKRGTVGVHARCIPAGDVHLPAYLTHHLAVALSQFLAPCAGDHRLCRESDGALTCKVIIDGHRTVRIDSLDFSY